MEFTEKNAIYLQIAENICAFILSKKWHNEERIPSIRETAVMMEVNPNTVHRAYDYLQSMGVIYNKRGIGYFVSEDGLEKTKTLKRLEFIENDLPEFIKKMQLLEISLDELISQIKNSINK